MNKTTILYLIFIFFCLIVQGFFSMFEMSSVSFSKVRLAYYTSKKMKKAIWLDYLLKRPSRLFGTTLIVVTAFIQLGSEAARRFYESLGLNPDLAPFSQVLLVLIFAELAPLFAARRSPEAVALFNVPVVYFISKMLFPITWVIDKFSSLVNYVFEDKTGSQFYLTKEEIQKVFEEKEKDFDISKTISNIFSLKNLFAKQLMVPLSVIKMVISEFTIVQTKSLFQKDYFPFFLIYHQNMQNIIAIATPRDLLEADPNELIKNHAHPPWFISEKSTVLEILKQFRRNNQSVAIILDSTGKAQGVITIDMILEQIFGRAPSKIADEKTRLITKAAKQIFIEKTLSGDMLILDFNKKFKANLPTNFETLGDLINSILEHHASEGEVIHIESFEFIVKEASLFGIKKVLVRTMK